MSFNTNVLAIDCYYNSDDGSEIKVILQDNGLGDLYPNINSSSYNYAYPLNGIYKIKNMCLLYWLAQKFKNLYLKIFIK